LQEQEFERVGASNTLKVDIRVIAATNRDLWEMVQKGSFRIDLYYRLNVFPIKVPALRERKEDIPYLCSNLIVQLNKRLTKQLKGLSNKAISQLQAYDWPGNIRELQNVLEREAILSKQAILQLSQPLQAISQSTINPALTLNEMQKQHIITVLKLSAWQISGSKGAAAKLGMPESTLRSKMHKLGISKIS
jgi:transcriptional regulator with GAF, ATPase, and Fis domain